MSEDGLIRVGTSGWQYREWRGRFYPEGLPLAQWFHCYAAAFDTVEINNTFYRMPVPTVVTRWRRQAPVGFVFAVKANQLITHRRRLHNAGGTLDQMLEAIRQLRPHLGPILYQLPPHWPCDVQRLRQFLGLLPAGLEHVFEFREPSWCNDEVRALLTEHGVSYCMHDMPGFTCAGWVTGPLVYLRLHGPTKVKYAGSYDRGQLHALATKVKMHARSGHAVFVYFNNTMDGHAAANALELRALLGLKPLAEAR